MNNSTMVILDIKHSKYYEDGYHEGWCNFSVNDYEFFGYGGPADYNTTEIDYWIERFTKLEHDLLIKSSYYFWQFDTDGWWLGFNFIDNENIEVLSGELEESTSATEFEAEVAPNGLSIKHREIAKASVLLEAIRNSLIVFE